MKIVTITFLSIIAASSAIPIENESNLVVMRHKLQVPEDPNSWVFNGESRSSKKGSKISNGWQAKDTDFPWVAEVSINLQSGGLLCTASLISNKWILGARHCIADTNAVSVQFSLGSASRSASRVKVFSDLIVWLNGVNSDEHPDIAVFRLAQTLALNSLVNTVRLPARSQAYWGFEGYILTAAGWGGVGGGALSNNLQWTNFKVLPRSQINFGDQFLVSQPPSGSASLEQGDSGGPSVIYENGIPTIVGINNRIWSSGSNKWQGHTRVGLYLDFISHETGIVLRN